MKKFLNNSFELKTFALCIFISGILNVIYLPHYSFIFNILVSIQSLLFMMTVVQITYLKQMEFLQYHLGDAEYDKEIEKKELDFSNDLNDHNTEKELILSKNFKK